MIPVAEPKGPDYADKCRVVYVYDDADSAWAAFEGEQPPFDRASRVILLLPDGSHTEHGTGG